MEHAYFHPLINLCNKILDEDNATYFWQTTRGGNSIIVSENGSYLTATSSVSFERHLSEFRKGRRNNS